MNNNIKYLVGTGINYLVATALVVSGILKLFAYEPYNAMIMELSPYYHDNIYLLGIIAIISGILFVPIDQTGS